MSKSTNINQEYELNDISVTDFNGVPSKTIQSPSGDDLELSTINGDLSGEFEDVGLQEAPAEDDVIFDDRNPNIVAQAVIGLRYYLFQVFKRNRKFFGISLAVLLVLLYHAYLIGAIYYAGNTLRTGDCYCNGVGLLIVMTGLTYWSVVYYFVIKKYFGRAIHKWAQKVLQAYQDRWYSRYVWSIAFLVAVIAFIAIDCRDEPSRIVSASGVLVIVAVCLLFSKHPGRVNWRNVIWGLGLQFIFGLIILRWNGGRAIFECFSSKMEKFLGFSAKGSNFIYGYLSEGFHQNFTSGDTLTLQPILAFNGLLVIFFFSFCINILYYYGIMMWIISKLGWLLQITIGTTAVESMSSAANVFVGMVEAPILVRPFLSDLTLSELHAVMAGGFATIAGTVMGAYISFGIKTEHLLSSSLMAAPAALAISKLLYPETKKSKTTTDQLKTISLKQEGTVLDAAAAGATQGVMLVLNIIANIIAFIAFVGFFNAVIQWLGGLVGLEALDFEWLLGKLFIPVAYVIGVEAKDTENVAVLLGLKTVVNEFVAYQRMMTITTLSERSRAIATFALCSFANFGSIGIQLTGIGCMAPERRKDLSKLIGSAFIAGVACGLLNACVAGALISNVPMNTAIIVSNATNSSSQP